MKRMQLSIVFALLTASVVIFAEKEGYSTPLLQDDPKRPVDQISRDLDIQSSAFRTCFTMVHPATQGDHPTSERVHTNKVILLSCLQRSNPTINNHSLDTVMDRYRPGGKQAQEPLP